MAEHYERDAELETFRGIVHRLRSGWRLETDAMCQWRWARERYDWGRDIEPLSDAERVVMSGTGGTT